LEKEDRDSVKVAKLSDVVVNPSITQDGKEEDGNSVVYLNATTIKRVVC
jgi:hypothetical protein